MEVGKGSKMPRDMGECGIGAHFSRESIGLGLGFKLLYYTSLLFGTIF